MSYYFPADSEERAERSRREAAVKTAADGVVFLQAPGQRKIDMQAVAKDTFLIRLAGAKITFERDESGEVAALVLDQAGSQTRGTKK